jgi:hypothetical protein
VEELRDTGLRHDLLVHAIATEANRGQRDKIGKKQIERVLDALDDLPSLLFEQEDPS